MPNQLSFVRFSFFIFGILLIPVSLMLGRALGDVSWNMPRPIGVGLGVVLLLIGFVTNKASLRTWLEKQKNLTEIILQCTLFVWGIILASLILEFGTRVAVVLNPDLAIRTTGHLIASKPPPYATADYFSPQFLAEMETATESYTPVGTRLILPVDRVGQYINVKNSRRLTTDQPVAPANMIYVFGASTIFSGDVPDKYTIPSYLQRLVIAQFGGRYRVENMGAVGIITAQQFERLQTVKLQPNDVVIFYDGSNDVGATLYHAKPEGFVVGEVSGNYLQTATTFQNLRLAIYRQIGGRSKFVTIFLYPYDPFPLPNHFKDSQKMAELKIALEKNFKQNLTMANLYAESSNAKLFHFLQPTIFTLATHSSYEKKLLNNKHIVYNGIPEAFDLGLPILYKAVLEQNAAGMASFDISAVLNERVAGEEFFIDYIHVTEKANARIAQAIFDKIAPSLAKEN